MKTIYTQDVPPRKKELGESVFPEVTICPPMPKVNTPITTQKPFSQKTKVITENQKDTQTDKIIDNLEARIKKLEKQLRFAIAANNKLDKAHNYLKERVSILTHKVDNLNIKLKK